MCMWGREREQEPDSEGAGSEVGSLSIGPVLIGGFLIGYSGMMFGSHLSIAGNMSNALREAEGLGMETVQVFTKNQRQWKVNALEASVREEWLAEQKRLGWTGRVVAHDSYLINLASPDDGEGGLWEKSVEAMRTEIERCEELGIAYLVSHPGAHMLKDGSLAPEERVRAGLRRIARGYKRLLRETRGYRTIVCLENTAGGGTTLGRSFEELAALKGLIEEEAGGDAKDRIGFCVDTCHALAAGYDIAAHEEVEREGKGTGKERSVAEGKALGMALLDEFDRVCGLGNLRVLHVNDSMGARGSCRDRHAHIGEGHVALGAFAAVVRRPGLAGVPKILETPKEESKNGRPMDEVNLARLKNLR